MKMHLLLHKHQKKQKHIPKIKLRISRSGTFNTRPIITLYPVYVKNKLFGKLRRKGGKFQLLAQKIFTALTSVYMCVVIKRFLYI